MCVCVRVRVPSTISMYNTMITKNVSYLKVCDIETTGILKLRCGIY